MIVIECDGCNTRLLEDLSQNEIVAHAKHATFILCDDCVRYGVRKYDPMHDQEALCECGHTYHRHFDPFEDYAPVGCKYCDGECERFKPTEPQE